MRRGDREGKEEGGEERILALPSVTIRERHDRNPCLGTAPYVDGARRRTIPLNQETNTFFLLAHRG